MDRNNGCKSKTNQIHQGLGTQEPGRIEKDINLRINLFKAILSSYSTYASLILSIMSTI
jgi:hypothetical protein